MTALTESRAQGPLGARESQRGGPWAHRGGPGDTKKRGKGRKKKKESKRKTKRNKKRKKKRKRNRKKKKQGPEVGQRCVLMGSKQ